MDRKLQLIDLVRSFSILSVMAYHLGYLCPPPHILWVKNLWVFFSTKGLYGVSLFFVVSGFLISRLIDTNLDGLLKPNLRHFYARRAGRILPLLCLVLLVGAFFIFFFPAKDKFLENCFKAPGASSPIGFWLSILTFSFNWFLIPKEASLNPALHYGSYWGVLWSLSVEEQFYLIYPFVLRYLRPLRYLFFLLCAVPVLGIISRFYVYLTDPYNFFLSFQNSLTGFEQIAFGIALYLAFKHFNLYLSREKTTSFLLWVLGTVVFLKVYLVRSQPFDFIWEPTLLALGLASFLLGGLNLGIFDSKFFHPFSLPGRMSYGMYLWHSLTLALLSPFLIYLNVWAAFMVFVLATLAWSSLSYFYFELPMNRWTRSILENKKSG